MENQIKILLCSVSLKRKGGVSNYINLLLNNISKNKINIKHFTQGKSYIKFFNIFLPFIIFVQLLKFKYILKKFKPNLIHLNPSLGWTAILRDFTSMSIAKKQKIPVLLFIHGWKKSISQFFHKKLFIKFFLHFLNKADMIIVLANEFKNQLIGLGIPEKKIKILTTMVESDKFFPGKKEFKESFTVLFCSRIDNKKGHFELLEAVPCVFKKYLKTKFIFMGDGPEFELLKKKGKNLENVKFLGYITGNKKINIFKKAHIFVLPSYSEGFPNVILEAMAAGMPLITTPVGGLADAIQDGKQGLIINSMPPDPKEIAEKIIKLIENPSLMKKMSENNLKEAREKYDVKVVSQQIEKIYNGVCSI